MAINGLTGGTASKLYELTGGKERKTAPQLRAPSKQKTPYAERMNRLLDEYLNREPYDFNINTDKLYRQYADMYKKQGEAAMRDTVAQAASKTGGYGSSYGVSAGAQAYQSYLDRLNEIIPTLEEKAYDRYTDKAAETGKKLDILDSLDSKEYDRYRDEVEDYKDRRDYYRKVYEYENDYDYDMYKSLTDYILSLAKLENSDYHDRLDYEIALAKLYNS